MHSTTRSTLKAAAAAACIAGAPLGAAAQESATKDASAPTLSQELDAKKASFNQSAPEATKAVYERGIQQVSESGALERALKEGDQAPDFTLAGADGAEVRLSALLADGPVVLTWYRGGWCPYCNIQLRAYQQSLPEFQKHGARLVALSPELPDNSLTTAEKNELAFHVLSDGGNKVAEAYGVVYNLPADVVEQFKGRLDLPKFNGDDSWRLPLAATYVIAKDGKIAYAFLDADYRKRAEPAAIIEALEALK
ncbi:MAG: peroxiredoxin-like family protein [Candidatus Sumerlaeia bacterium]|nr:peroxiredoxin-like family protein [Candidatus Sumerlaeia bacterium]